MCLARSPTNTWAAGISRRSFPTLKRPRTTLEISSVKLFQIAPFRARLSIGGPFCFKALFVSRFLCGKLLVVFAQRSHKLERIDTGDYTQAEYERFLREIRFINQRLGDSAALRASLLRDIEEKRLTEFSVLD